MADRAHGKREVYEADWKRRNISFYYRDAPPPEDPVLPRDKTALLVIDVQNTYLSRPDRSGLSGASLAEYDAWTPFHSRMHGIVLPAIARLQAAFRSRKMDVLFARIACHLNNGRDRSLSQKLPGWNNVLLPEHTEESQIAPEVAPQGDEIVVTKTTDSALTGTGLRLILHNLGISHVVCCGIFTDQCVSSTVRALADESFTVLLAEDCCAAGTMELHRQELAVLNRIYAQVMSSDELMAYLPGR